VYRQGSGKETRTGLIQGNMHQDKNREKSSMKAHVLLCVVLRNEEEPKERKDRSQDCSDIIIHDYLGREVSSRPASLAEPLAVVCLLHQRLRLPRRSGAARVPRICLCAAMGSTLKARGVKRGGGGGWLQALGSSPTKQAGIITDGVMSSPYYHAET
jgi:hypothetical protein